VFCVVVFTVPVILSVTFYKTLEVREKNGGFVIDEYPIGSANEPAVRYGLPAL